MHSKSEIITDVAIVGGGTAGMVAAIAAARNGANTLLIEKYGFLGGTATYGIPFLAFVAGNGTRVVDGIPEEIVNQLVSMNASLGHVRGATWKNAGILNDYEFCLTPYDADALKFVVEKMALESGVKILYHSYFSNVEVKEGLIKGIEIVNKSGKQWIYAHAFIDATGDGDVAAQSGCLYSKGNCEGKMQNVTTLLRMGAVNMDEMERALMEGRNILGWNSWYNRIVKKRKVDSDRESCVHMAGHMVPWGDDRHVTFTAVSHRENEVLFNITRVPGIDSTNIDHLVTAEIKERENIFELVEGLKKNVAGFDKSYIISTSPQIGIRESRNVIGKYVITSEDVINCKEFHDNIARGCYPIDIHDPGGGKTKFVFLKDRSSYGIPFRALIPKGCVSNLITAGRCVSADHKAHGTVRIMATAMAIGQAAGTAACLASKRKTNVPDIDINELRNLLHKQSAILDKADVIEDK